MVIKEFQVTAAQERCLRDQVISADQPGTVLRDFQMLLDFLQNRGGVEAGGKYNLLPIKHLLELDQALSHPLNLKLKRPQLRSHPYLQGLHLLLRASGLVIVAGEGDKARLCVDPAMLMQWQQLNPTEQYFNLLEAWLRFGRAEMIAEQGSGLYDEFMRLQSAFALVPARARKPDPGKPQPSYEFYFVRAEHPFALMDLFGLIEVEHPKQSPEKWAPAGAHRTDFGDALIKLLMSDRWGGLSPKPRPAKVDEEQGQDNPSEEDVPWLPRFGEWQRLFQPYFPEWRENLVLEEPEPREGTFVFRVSWAKVQRLIAMPSDSDLHDLLMWILKSVNFDDDHLYQFTFRNRLGASIRVSDARMGDGDIFADMVPIGTLPLELGQSMTMLYDFGDEWEFTIKLERIEPPGAKIKAPRILEKRGKSPKQYPNWDDDD